MSEKRDKLRAAIEQRVAAKIAETNANEALARAKAMKSQAEEELSRYQSLDADIAAFRGAAIKEAVLCGAVVTELDALPAELNDKKAARAALLEKIESIKGVIGELVVDCEGAKRLVEKRLYEVELAIEGVLVEEARAKATELLRQYENAVRQHSHLLACAGRFVPLEPDAAAQAQHGRKFRHINLAGDDTNRAVHLPIGANFDVERGPQVRQRWMQEIDNFVKQLRLDPDARLQ